MRVAINFLAEGNKLIDRHSVDFEYIDNVPYRKNLPPASAQWLCGTDDQIASLWFTCPHGCGLISAVTVNPRYGKHWEWDNDKEKPTMRPSILFPGGCQWHGYLTRGLFGLTMNPESEAP